MIERLREVYVTRYVTALREGGSLPAIAEADDGFLYAVKFRGAGQGVKALIAELIGGKIASALGLKTPELVFAYLDEAFGRTEPDEEIQHLLKASVGLNLGVHYLSGAVTFDPVVTTIDSELASKIVWLDALLMNVDRTCRNTNMLMWHKELWLIDHGASLYFHHGQSDFSDKATASFSRIKDHVLLRQANSINDVNKSCRAVLTPDVIDAIVSLLPFEWLAPDSSFGSAEENRNAYAQFLNDRIAQSDIFVTEIENARQELV